MKFFALEASKYSLTWISFGFSFLMLAAALMPRRVFFRLQSLGLVGLVLTILINALAQAADLWKFPHSFLTVAYVPAGFAIGWYAETIIFGFLLIKYGRWRAAIAFALALLTVVVNHLMILRGLLRFGPNWSLLDTFFLALILHTLLDFIFRVLVERRGRAA